jgi:hypothetical protein
MRRGRSSSGSDSDWTGSSKSSSSSGKRATARSRRSTATEVFPPKPRAGHPNQLPKPELRAKLLAPVLRSVGTSISNISDVVVGNYYLVVAKNRKGQPAAYCVKATEVSGANASFYFRDFRGAGFGTRPGTITGSASNIYKVTDGLTSSLEAEGMWFNEREYDR